MVAPLTANDRAKLMQSGAIKPPPVKAAPDPELPTTVACRAWQTALANARQAFDELKAAEAAYIAACERDKGRASRRRVPAIDPYHVTGAPTGAGKRSAA